MKRTTLLPREWGPSLRSVLGIAALGLLVVAILAFPYLNRGGTIVELKGTVVAPFEWPNDGTVADSSYYMRVTLESGEEVRVQIPRDTAVVPGKTVVLAGRQGKLGFTTYGFRRYAD